MPIDRSQIPAPDPTRVATDAFTGYVYQCYLGVLRWLTLDDNEALLCEGDEDLDRLIFDENGVLVGGTLEQVKHYKAVQASTLRKVLGKFLVSFHALRTQGDDRRFVLTTTAPAPRTASERALLRFVESWEIEQNETPERRERVEAGVHRLFEGLPDGKAAEKKRKQEIAAALGWLDDEPERWTEVRRAVELSFNAPDLGKIKSQIVAELLKRDEARELPPSLADRLVQDIVAAHTEPDHLDRVRTGEDLVATINRLGDELGGWAESIQGRSLLELREVSRLLSTGAQPLPERALEPDGPRGLLLTAAHEVVPFDEEGRRDELDFLVERCKDDRRAGVMLLHGDGGAGKTRLMIEVCRRFRERGWIAGFLPSETKAAPVDVRKLLSGHRPRLLVLDYAETRPSITHPLLLELADLESGPKTRVVFLSRKLGDWWTELPKKLGTPVENLLYPAGASAPERPVTPLAAPTGRREELFATAHDSFRFLIGGTDEDSVPNLTDDLYGKPLYLHMAALASLRGEPVTKAGDALRRTYEHEERYWNRKVAEEAPPQGVGEKALGKSFARALTGLTLVGGAATEAGAEELLDRLDIRDQLRDAVFELLTQLYPGSDSSAETGFLEALTPDLLGEELVAHWLPKDRPLLRLLLDDAPEEASRQVLTVLTRLAQRDPERGVPLIRAALDGRIDALAQPAFEAAVAVGDPLGRVMVEVVPQASAGTLKWLGHQMDRAGDHLSVALRELGVAVLEAQLEAHDAEVTVPGEDAQVERTRLLNNLGGRYHDLGQREEAVRITEEAVQIRRRLAEWRPEFSREDLAMSLNNLGAFYLALGRPEEAIEATQEAIEATQEAIQFRRGLPSPHPDLAQSLNNLGASYAAVGQREEAAQAIEEAVQIYRNFDTQPNSSYRPDLAMSVNNVGISYADLGRSEEALQAAEEAVKLFRDLAGQRPDAFRSHLAASLSNLGARLYRLQKPEPGFVAVNESIEIRRGLAAVRPTAFLHELSDSLHNRCLLLRQLARHEEAIQSIEEAIRIDTPYLIQYPQAFGPKFLTRMNEYVCTARAAGLRVDPEVLEPVADFLEAEDWSEADVECPGEGPER